MGLLRRLAAEPLPVFLLLGALLFLADRWRTSAAEDAAVIEITPDQVRSLSEQWQQQMGQEPKAGELKSLIDERVKEEVLYREALKLGLDQEDAIVRRRLAQKMSFLIEDAMVDEPPEAKALEGYFRLHAKDYRLPELLSFSHVFLSGDPQSAGTRAGQILAVLEQGGDPNLQGDPFMLRRNYSGATPAEIGRLFGDDFAGALARLPAGTAWHGPVASAYGLHLVRVESRIPGREPALAEVAAQVAQDFAAERQRRHNEAEYQRLRAGYDIRLPTP